MGKVMLYIAMSLDGFIARRDDDVAWLEPYTNTQTDYGYRAFLQGIGTAVMGARTFAESRKHPERLLSGLKTYVLSQTQRVPVPAAGVEIFSRSPAELVAKIRAESRKDIFLVGGGQVVSSFLKQELIDEMRLFVVPVLLGEGILLFAGARQDLHWQLAETVQYPTGIVQLHYRK